MSIDFQHSKVLTLVQSDPSVQTSLGHRQPLHPRLACIIQETLDVRKNNDHIRNASINQRTVFISLLL